MRPADFTRSGSRRRSLALCAWTDRCVRGIAPAKAASASARSGAAATGYPRPRVVRSSAWCSNTSPRYTHIDTLVVDQRTFVRFNIAEGQAFRIRCMTTVCPISSTACSRMAFPTAGAATLRVIAADYEDCAVWISSPSRRSASAMACSSLRHILPDPGCVWPSGSAAPAHRR